MKIILGQELDGNVFHNVSGNTAEAGIMTAGTAGFLDYLEQALGLPQKKKSFLRVFQYERALRDSPGDSPFYAGSFALDPYGAADLLLKSRDEILLSAPSSFDLASFSTEDERLGTFAAVEKKFGAMNPEPGVPDRIREVVRELKTGRMQVNIDEIILADERSSWHVLFRELLDRLERRGVKISPFPRSYPDVSGDLASVRRYLSDDSSQAVPVKGDGSLRLVRGRSPGETADFLATLIEPLLRDGERILLIDGSGTSLVRDSLIGRGLPAPDCEVRYFGLPILQLLPLYLSLQFPPPDLENLVRYLSLPWLPVPVDLKNDLLEALTSVPGTGSSRWRTVLERHSSGFSGMRAPAVTPAPEAWLTFGTAGENGKLRTGRIEEICANFTAALHERKKRFRFREGEDVDWDEEGIEPALLQTGLLRSVLALRSVSEIGSAELAGVFRDIAGSFVTKEKREAEAGSVWSVPSPSSVLGRADTVVFWNFTESAVPVPARLIFSSDERRILSRSGVEFLTPRSLYVSHQEAVIRAVSSASKRLYLVCPEQDGGEQVNPHPAWYRMIKAFREADEPETGLCMKSDAWLSAGSDSRITAVGMPSWRECGKVVVFDRISMLPEPVRPVKRLSPSSLRTFLGCPLSYVLTSEAGMKSAVMELPRGNRLYGTIAHDVIEACIDEDRDFRNVSTIRDRLKTAAESYISRSAAPLLSGGMDRERAFVVRKIVEGGAALVSALSRGGYRVISMEDRSVAGFESIEMEGIPDIVVENRHTGKRAVIDLKWTSENNFRDLLSDGINMQTAVYSFLLDSIPTAYFIITAGRFLTVHPDLFPETDSIDGPPEGDVWAGVAAAIRVRVEALGKKIVAVGPTQREWKAERKEGSGNFFSPAPCTFCDHRLYCGSQEK